MHVCLIQNTFPPFHKGGADRVVVHTATLLVSLGYQVTVVTLGSQTKDVWENGIHIYRLSLPFVYPYGSEQTSPIGAKLCWHIQNLWDRRMAKAVRAILEREKPDVVHTHNLMGLSFLLPRVIRLLGIPHVHTIHDVQLLEPSAIIVQQQQMSWRYHNPMTALYIYYTRWLFGSPHIVTGSSVDLLGVYQRYHFFAQSKIVRLENPRTIPFTSRTHIEKTGEIRFLFVGQIESHKGIEALLTAAVEVRAQLQQQGVSLRLDIVGDGTLKESLMVMYAKHSYIQWYGKLDRQDIEKRYEDTDVLVVPSLCYENTPSVVYEAFSFSLPVIVSDSTGLSEMVEQGVTGLVCAVGQQYDLVRTLVRYATDRELRQSMREAIAIRESRRDPYLYSTTLTSLYQELHLGEKK